MVDVDVVSNALLIKAVDNGAAQHMTSQAGSGCGAEVDCAVLGCQRHLRPGSWAKTGRTELFERAQLVDEVLYLGSPQLINAVLLADGYMT